MKNFKFLKINQRAIKQFTIPALIDTNIDPWLVELAFRKALIQSNVQYTRNVTSAILRADHLPQDLRRL